MTGKLSEIRVWFLLANRLWWVEWSRDRWRHATVWRHSADMMACSTHVTSPNGLFILLLDFFLFLCCWYLSHIGKSHCYVCRTAIDWHYHFIRCLLSTVVRRHVTSQDSRSSPHFSRRRRRHWSKRRDTNGQHLHPRLSAGLKRCTNYQRASKTAGHKPAQNWPIKSLHGAWVY